MIYKLDKIKLITHYNNDDMELLIASINKEGSQLGRLPLYTPKTNDAQNLIFAIMFNAGGKEERLIGRVSLENICHINQSAELKIFISDEHVKKGFAFDACKKVIEHGFNELNLQRIEAGTLSNNEGFKKLAEKLGMIEEGIRRKAVWKSGEFLSVFEYGLLRSEPIETKSEV